MDNEEKKIIKRLERARESKKLDDWEVYCRRLAEHRASLGHYEGALDSYKEELSVCEMKGDAAGIATAHRMVGEMYSTLGQFSESLDHVNKYLSFARKTKNSVEEQRALATIGRTYFCWAAELKSTESSLDGKVKLGEVLKECRKAYKKSLYICEEELQNLGHRQRQEMKARILFNLGLACEIEDDISAALNYVSQAIHICKQELLMEDLHRCYISQCTMNLRKGESAAALSSADLAMEVAKKLNNSTELTVLSILHKSEVYFAMSNYKLAKTVLKKAYKMKSPIQEDREAVELSLKRAVLLCDIESKLAATDENALVERKALFEKLGDACCSVKNYKHAIQSYLNMLNCALTLGQSEKDLQPCYVSLYQTYKDDQKYDLALEFAKKEFEVSKDNPNEAAKSHIVIGEILEVKGASYYEVSEEYLAARRLASESGNVALQASALRHLSAAQQADGREDLAKETERELQALPYADSEDVNSDDEEQPLSGIHLSDLSDSDDELARPRQARNTFKVTRNEKGETPLHVAAIRGDVSRAERLLALGHPVKERDLAGWTPLHEAANHGHDDIVRTLIKAGANVNDPGGRDCGGITPLHDAASCGHFGIIKTLLESNASVTVLTDSGETPLDCLKAWRERVDNLRGEEESIYNELVEELSAKLSKEGFQKPTTVKRPPVVKKETSRPKERPRRPMFNLRREVDDLSENRGWERVSPERAVRAPSPSRSSPELMSIPDSPPPVRRSPEKPVANYRSAMDAIRKRPAPIEHHSKPSSKGPLLDESSYVDEWLEDDLRNVRAQKKKRKCDEFVERSNVRARRNSEELFPDFCFPLDEPTDFQNRDEPTRKKSKTQSTLADAGFTSTPAPPAMVHLHDSPIISADTNIDFPSLPSPPFSSVSDHAITKVRINVGRLILLVPIDSSKVDELTIRWLAEEAGKRYYEIEGAQPQLQLKTKDGAILAATDQVSLALGEDLESTITGWQTDCLTDRYNNAVKQDMRKPVSAYGAYRGGVDQAVVERLAACDSSRHLDLSYMSLTNAELAPILKALKHERRLRVLNLSGNVLGDTGLEALSQSLEHCAIEEINLRCNNITTSGFAHFVDGMDKKREGDSTGSLQSLQSLDLSFNPLGTSVQDNKNKLTTIFPKLTTLKADNCENDFFLS